jgi:methionyl-tRNA synthetase
MPNTSEKIARQLGLTDGYKDINAQRCWGVLSNGSKITKETALFPRHALFDSMGIKQPIPTEKIISMTSNEKPTVSISSTKSMIQMADFEKLDLRVGIIQSAEKIEKSDKLLKLVVDIGLEQRQVVAGIAGKYLPDVLIGKRIILICNLAPAKIRGVLSEGMLLAAGDGSVLGLATFLEEIPAGKRIK